MWKNITIISGGLFIWGCVGGFDWVIDSLTCYDIVTNKEVIQSVQEVRVFSYEEVMELVLEAIQNNELDSEGVLDIKNVTKAELYKNIDLFNEVEENINKLLDKK